MPIKEFQCNKCKKIYEFIFLRNLKINKKCPDCKIKLSEIEFSVNSFLLKGKWFKTGGY